VWAARWRPLAVARGGAIQFAPSARRPHPAGDGPPDLVRRIFLDKMDSRHRLLGQRWPPADEVDQRIIGYASPRLLQPNSRVEEQS
jgi:hypothetical protein